jgi:hypothetical protein
MARRSDAEKSEAQRVGLILPRKSVVSGEIVEGFEGRFVGEASEPGSIVVVDEGEDVLVSGGVAWESLVVACGVEGDAGEMLGEPAIETFDHSVGLRPEGAAELVADVVLGAEAVDGMIAGGTVVGLVFLVDGEAIGPFAAVVGEDGVDLEGEGLEEAGEEGGGGLAVALAMDFEIDEAGGAIDGDEGVGRLAVDAREMLEVDVDEPGGSIGGEALSRIGALLRARRDAMALEAAVDAAARQLGVEAAPEHFDDIVERQSEASAQLDRQALLLGGQRCGDAVRAMGTVVDVAAAAPAGDGVVAHSQFADEFAGAGAALLNVGPGGRRGRGQFVQTGQHDGPCLCSATNRMPAIIAGRSSQSPGTKYKSGGGGPCEAWWRGHNHARGESCSTTAATTASSASRS